MKAGQWCDCHCLADAGLPMWKCHWSDNVEAEDAMPCLCLCHPESEEAKEGR